MKKSIFYILFLIILPISFGSSENAGCKGMNNSDNEEQADKPSHSGNSSNEIE